MDYFDEDELEEGPRYGPDSSSRFALMREAVNEAESAYHSMVEHDEAGDALNDESKAEPLYEAAGAAGKSSLKALDDLDRLSRETRDLLTPPGIVSEMTDWADRLGDRSGRAVD